MFVQVALPINNPLGFYDLNERLFIDANDTGRSQVYSYSVNLSERREEDFEFGLFMLVNNIDNFYTGSIAPTTSLSSYSGFETQRVLPPNPNESNRVSTSGTDISFANLGNTITQKTCLCIQLKLGNTHDPRSMGIKNRDFDFYCEFVSPIQYDTSRLHAFLMADTSSIPSNTSAVNRHPTKANSVVLNINRIDSTRVAISGFIPSDSEWYSSNYFAYSTGRLYLILFVDDILGFGASVIQSTIRFPYGNADSWHKLWDSNYIPPLDSTLFNYYYNADVLDYISSAISYVSTSIFGLGFWFTPIGVMTSILPLSACLGLALLFIILEKFSI